MAVNIHLCQVFIQLLPLAYYSPCSFSQHINKFGIFDRKLTLQENGNLSVGGSFKVNAPAFSNSDTNLTEYQSLSCYYLHL